jgi:hypothetical protein
MSSHQCFYLMCDLCQSKTCACSCHVKGRGTVVEKFKDPRGRKRKHNKRDLM